MKKFLILLAAIMACLLVFAACDLNKTDEKTETQTAPSETETTHTHTWSEWNTAKEATCTETGLQECACACGKKETQGIASLGHDYTATACTRCGKATSAGLNFISYGNDTCCVKSIGSCTDTDVVIPPVSPDGDTVTSIGNSAFENCDNLTSIEIPGSVTNIGQDVFDGCIALTSIIFEGTVEQWNAISLKKTGIPTSPPLRFAAPTESFLWSNLPLASF